MKEKLYTIELTDAVKADDECIFCRLERKLEQESLAFVLGSSYMESDVRQQTSVRGFCRNHTKMMFDYGNTLGNAWILKSRLEYVRKELARYTGQDEAPGPDRDGFLSKLRPGGRIRAGRPGGDSGTDGAVSWIRGEADHCYICGRIRETYGRMLDTFVYMLASDPEFGELLMKSKGFCLPHFADAVEACAARMKPGERQEWLAKLSKLMGGNLDRIQEDVDWLIEKYDYRNRDAGWKNSEDAVQRAMQKLAGGHPADPVFRAKG